MESRHEQTDFAAVESALKTFPGFDQAAFEQLISDTEPTVGLKILARFSVNVTECMAEIKTALQTDESQRVWQACHKLTGTSELLGFRKFGQQARELNLGIRASADLHAHNEEITAYLGQCQEVLNKIRSCFPALSSYL